MVKSINFVVVTQLGHGSCTMGHGSQIVTHCLLWMRRQEHCYWNCDATKGTLTGWGAGVKTRQQLYVDQQVAGTF